MLIDTSHIDRLRVNFVAHFNTENNVISATNEINTLIDNYPKEMTTQVRQWLKDQQRPRSLTAAEISKYMDEFDEYLKELEENILQYQQNENNHIKLKVFFCLNEIKKGNKILHFQKLIHQIETRPTLPDNLNNPDKQRLEHLQQRFLKIKKQFDDLQKTNASIKTNINNTISHINTLITCIKDIEEQIKTNTKQPINDYERLILDCQVSLITIIPL